jgi:hypothetical protein
MYKGIQVLVPITLTRARIYVPQRTNQFSAAYEMIHPAGHGTDTSDMENFMKRLTGDAGPSKQAKPMTPGQKRMWILFAK